MKKKYTFITLNGVFLKKIKTKEEYKNFVGYKCKECYFRKQNIKGCWKLSCGLCEGGEYFFKVVPPIERLLHEL